MRAGREAGRQAGRPAGRQAGRQARRQARRQAGSPERERQAVLRERERVSKSDRPRELTTDPCRTCIPIIPPIPLFNIRPSLVIPPPPLPVGATVQRFGGRSASATASRKPTGDATVLNGTTASSTDVNRRELFGCTRDPRHHPPPPPPVDMFNYRPCASPRLAWTALRALKTRP